MKATFFRGQLQNLNMSWQLCKWYLNHFDCRFLFCDTVYEKIKFERFWKISDKYDKYNFDPDAILLYDSSAVVGVYPNFIKCNNALYLTSNIETAKEPSFVKYKSRKKHVEVRKDYTLQHNFCDILEETKTAFWVKMRSQKRPQRL